MMSALLSPLIFWGKIAKVPQQKNADSGKTLPPFLPAAPACARA